MENLSAHCRRWRVSRRTASRALRETEVSAPPSPLLSVADKALVLDATELSSSLVALIARTPDDGGIAWAFAERENYTAWHSFLSRIADTPRGIVSDAQKGLKKAVRERFPEVSAQRCVFHLIRLACAWITRRPKTVAGKQLRTIVVSLTRIWSDEEARQWTVMFLRWYEHYRSFLAERTVSLDGRSSWLTHRKLAQAASLVRRSIPELFTYCTMPGLPRTTNHVEGGINAGIAELMRRHRGISLTQKKTAVALFLSKRRGKVATRNGA